MPHPGPASVDRFEPPQWLPPRKTYDCRYVAKQITIKTKYVLWVTPAERTAMSGVLKTCT